MLYVYKGVDVRGKKQRAYIHAESKTEAMHILKQEKGLVAVFYLQHRTENKYVLKVVDNWEIGTEKIKQQVEQNKEKVKEKKRERKDKKETRDVAKILGRLRKRGKAGSLQYNEEELDEKILQIFKMTEGLASVQEYMTEDYIEVKPDIQKIVKPRIEKKELEIDWGVIEGTSKKAPKGNMKIKIKETEILLFTKRMALMLNAGLPLLKALTITETTVSKKFRPVITGVIEDIQRGTPFSSAIAKYPRQFDTTYIALILIGESTGNFASCLKDIVAYRERRNKVQSKLKSASIYPIIMSVVLSGVVVVGSLFFIPMFKALFDEQGIALPTITRVVFKIADIAPYLIIALVVVLVVLKVACKYVKPVDRLMKRILSTLALKMPVIKGVTLPSNMYTFAATASLMLGNGIRVNEVLKLVLGVVGNVHIKTEIAAMGEYILQGMPLSKAIAEQKYFDPLLGSIVLTGEETGKLSEALKDISLYYDDIVNNKITILTELFQPLSILLIGLIAIPVVIAVYLPILDISSGGTM